MTEQGCAEPARRPDLCHCCPQCSSAGLEGLWAFGVGVVGGRGVMVGGRERRQHASKNQSSQDSRGSLELRAESSSSLMWSADENTFLAAFLLFPSISSISSFLRLPCGLSDNSLWRGGSHLQGAPGNMTSVAMGMTMTFSVIA